MTRALLLISAIAFFVTGLGYLLIPGTMLSVVGIASAATSDFLIRTEGVALISAAVFVWAVRDAGPGPTATVLVGLSVYYVLGSVVDLAAFLQSIVGPASVPSAAVRIVLGCLCAWAAAGPRRRDSSAS
jgi:hypothetical protein